MHEARAGLAHLLLEVNLVHVAPNEDEPAERQQVTVNDEKQQLAEERWLRRKRDHRELVQQRNVVDHDHARRGTFVHAEEGDNLHTQGNADHEELAQLCHHPREPEDGPRPVDPAVNEPWPRDATNLSQRVEEDRGEPEPHQRVDAQRNEHLVSESLGHIRVAGIPRAVCKQALEVEEGGNEGVAETERRAVSLRCDLALFNFHLLEPIGRHRVHDPL
mmetsp:Transcript_6439/g.19336  ORF Transcript_6439/g.19336 Transcript_6439/m.19336 type:complete len:218 (-) Transcript_6439:399-1052(-)